MHAQSNPLAQWRPTCVSAVPAPYIVLRHQDPTPLHHMVRNITGPAAGGGRGQPVSGLPRVLAERDRNLAGPTAKAGGLI